MHRKGNRIIYLVILLGGFQDIRFAKVAFIPAAIYLYAFFSISQCLLHLVQLQKRRAPIAALHQLAGKLVQARDKALAMSISWIICL